MMLVDELRDALENDETDKIVAIEKKCREQIRSEVGEKRGQFKVPHDPFTFNYHINDSIKKLVLDGHEYTENNMVVAGRYVIMYKQHFI